MKIGIVFQVFTVLYQYKIITAIYGFGDEPEDPKRIRIFLEDDEKLLVPKNSKVEYVNPVLDFDKEVILDKPPNFSTYVTQVIKKPLYLPSQPYYNNQVPVVYEKPTLSTENLNTKSDYADQSQLAANLFGSYFGDRRFGLDNSRILHQAAVLPEIRQHPISYRKLLRPILLLPNGWIQGVNFGGTKNDIKPVTEEQADDLKYDFRTKTHSIR